MKKYRLVFVLSILFLGVIKLTASEYEQVRKAPRVHVSGMAVICTVGS